MWLLVKIAQVPNYVFFSGAISTKNVKPIAISIRTNCAVRDTCRPILRAIRAFATLFLIASARNLPISNLGHSSPRFSVRYTR